jgi:2-keto-4-pentenoate hydratase/2-oxohepta-3-ene-1,7-dioic acid hydratase in catechol pathway
MQWCRFQSGQKVAYGIIDNDTVTEVTGSPFDNYARTASTYPLSAVKLLVPVIPPTFYAAGINYREHVTEMAKRRGVEPEFPPAADVGYRANNALVAADEPIVIPKDATELVQYEGELVAVIGKKCRHVSESEAWTMCSGTPSAMTSASAPGSGATAPSGAARTPIPSNPWARGSSPASTPMICM